ncbi:MAG TPA: hypothetical protein VHT27_02275 [Solirubrobacteraceae bacterium]|nr:hypothetical protein [Solirubrobacteraceae bacterium]
MAGMRRGFARRLALALLACALTTGAGALAASPASAAELGNSFNELTSKPAETQATTATSTTTTSSAATETNNSNSRTLVLGALAAAVILLSIIGFVIVRDARRVAPAVDGDLTEERSARDAAVQLRKRRAKAKAARQQRKRNR